MLTTLGPGGWETVRENPDRINAVRTEVENLGLRVVAQYALMGQYDFLNIIEAPDEKAMARAAVMLAARHHAHDDDAGHPRRRPHRVAQGIDALTLLHTHHNSRFFSSRRSSTGEEDGQHRVVGSATHAIALVAAVFDNLCDLEPARPMGVEPRSDLHAGPRTHAADRKPVLMGLHDRKASSRPIRTAGRGIVSERERPRLSDLARRTSLLGGG